MSWRIAAPSQSFDLITYTTSDSQRLNGEGEKKGKRKGVPGEIAVGNIERFAAVFVPSVQDQDDACCIYERRDKNV